MKIVHTYINSMYITTSNELLQCFAHRWGLVGQAQGGHQVTLLCGSESRRRREYQWNNIRVIELPCLWRMNNTAKLLKGFCRELWKINADVFHTHHYCPLIPELTAIIGRLRRIPTYITFHNTFVEGKNFAKLLGSIYLVCMQPFLPLYCKSFFISRYLASRWSFSLIPQKKVHLAQNQLSLAPVTNQQHERQGIVYLGRLTHQKGVDVLLKAFALLYKKFPNQQLTIIGFGESSYVKELQVLTAKLGIENQVKFLGKVEGQKKWDQLQQAKVMVIPSRDEGFGNVVIEGLLAQTPLIVSSAGALAEAAENYCQVFRSQDVHDLRKKMLEVLLDQDSVKQQVEEGLAYAQAFVSRNLGSELIEHYRS